MCSTCSEHTQYLLANLALKLAHLGALPRVLDPKLVDQMVGRRVYVDILTHQLSRRQKLYVGSGTGEFSILSRVAGYTYLVVDIFHTVLIWLRGWQPSFHLLTIPLFDASKHRVWTILNETFGCAMTGSYRIKKPMVGHNNAELVAFITAWRKKHNLLDLDPENEVGVNYALPLSQGVGFEGYSKDLACSNCHTLLRPKQKSYSAISGLLWEKTTRICGNCFKFNHHSGEDRPAYMEHSRLVRNLLKDDKDCTVCGDNFSGSLFYFPELYAKLCGVCRNLWLSALRPIPKLYTPKDFHYACDKYMDDYVAVVMK